MKLYVQQKWLVAHFEKETGHFFLLWSCLGLQPQMSWSGLDTTISSSWFLVRVRVKLTRGDGSESLTGGMTKSSLPIRSKRRTVPVLSAKASNAQSWLHATRRHWGFGSLGTVGRRDRGEANAHRHTQAEVNSHQEKIPQDTNSLLLQVS